MRREEEPTQMKPPLKLSAIEQEHLQDLYDAAGVARDELPYTPAFEQFVQDFQDRTFKNAEPEQFYGAIIKYTRTSSNALKNDAAELPLNEEQLKQLKVILSRHASAGRVMPYSDGFNNAKNEFKRTVGVELTDLQFWQAVLKTAGSKRKPPPPRKKVSKADDEDDE
jgi:hypothetical protein